MNDLIRLFGIPCASCGYPARSHDLSTGQTFHVVGKPPCQTQLPRR